MYVGTLISMYRICTALLGTLLHMLGYIRTADAVLRHSGQPFATSGGDT